MMSFFEQRRDTTCACGYVLCARKQKALDDGGGRPQPYDAMVCARCGTPYILQEDLSLLPMTKEMLDSPLYEHVRKVIDEAAVTAAMGNIQL